MTTLITAIIPNILTKRNQDMELAEIAFLVYQFLVELLGICANILIVFIGNKNCRREGCRSPGDVILTALGFYNVLLQIFIVGSIAIFYFRFDIFISYYFFRFMYSIYYPICLSGSWLTALLCMFYCIKITTFKWKCFLYVKSHFPGKLPWMIVGLTCLSFLLISPVSASLRELNTSNNSIFHKSNMGNPYMVSIEFVVIVIIWSCLSCFLILTSLVLTLASLGLHVCRMKKSSNFSCSQISAHINGIRTMTLLLIIYITLYLSQVVLVLGILTFSSTWFWVLVVFHCSFYTLQGVILISANPKLYNVVKNYFTFSKAGKRIANHYK